jgi:hypothetical protein
MIRKAMNSPYADIVVTPLGRFGRRSGPGLIVYGNPAIGNHGIVGRDLITPNAQEFIKEFCKLFFAGVRGYELSDFRLHPSIKPMKSGEVTAIWALECQARRAGISRRQMLTQCPPVVLTWEVPLRGDIRKRAQDDIDDFSRFLRTERQAISIDKDAIDAEIKSIQGREAEETA